MSEVKNVYWTQNFMYAAIVTKTCNILMMLMLHRVADGEQELGDH